MPADLQLTMNGSRTWLSVSSRVPLVQAACLKEFTTPGKKEKAEEKRKWKKLCHEHTVTSVLPLGRGRGQVSPLADETMSLIIRFPAGLAEEWSFMAGSIASASIYLQLLLPSQDLSVACSFWEERTCLFRITYISWTVELLVFHP